MPGARKARVARRKEAPVRRTGVILDFVFEAGLLHAVVRNLEDEPALRVRTVFDKEFRGLGGTRAMNSLALFENIEFLAPGREIRTLVDTTAAYFARREPTRLTATVSYQTAGGEPRRTTTEHDLGIYREIAYVPQE